MAQAFVLSNGASITFGKGAGTVVTNGAKTEVTVYTEKTTFKDDKVYKEGNSPVQQGEAVEPKKVVKIEQPKSDSSSQPKKTEQPKKVVKTEQPKSDSSSQPKKTEQPKSDSSSQPKKTEQPKSDSSQPKKTEQPKKTAACAAGAKLTFGDNPVTTIRPSSTPGKKWIKVGGISMKVDDVPPGDVTCVTVEEEEKNPFRSSNMTANGMEVEVGRVCGATTGKGEFRVRYDDKVFLVRYNSCYLIKDEKTIIVDDTTYHLNLM